MLYYTDAILNILVLCTFMKFLTHFFLYEQHLQLEEDREAALRDEEHVPNLAVIILFFLVFCFRKECSFNSFFVLFYGAVVS